jgi:hypothetical protein
VGDHWLQEGASFLKPFLQELAKRHYHKRRDVLFVLCKEGFQLLFSNFELLAFVGREEGRTLKDCCVHTLLLQLL